MDKKSPVCIYTIFVPSLTHLPNDRHSVAKKAPLIDYHAYK